jgi:tripartite-type tricarboxylate transporter receptor subunit TctC
VSSIAIALALCGCAVLSAAAAQYPERPLRFVIPFPPGGGADNLARIVGQAAGERLGQQIVIDNRAGAGGNIAADIAAKAAPDGYTLLQANIAHAISASLYKKLNYDLARDFVPVTQLASIPFVLLANPSFPFGNVRDLIAAAKAKPGQYTYASSGVGGPSHMAMELFKTATGVDIRHVPYKGAAPMATDMIGGQVNMGFFTVSAALPLIRGGRLKPIAIASARRSPLAPDLPTFEESGVPGFEATTWFGVMAPSGTPKHIVDRLYAVFSSVLKEAQVHDRLAHQGFELVGSTPAQFAQYVHAELGKWAQVVRTAHVAAR